MIVVEAVDALHGVLDRLGDLLLDDLRRGARVGRAAMNAAGNSSDGQQLLLERRDREQPERGDDDRDSATRPRLARLSLASRDIRRYPPAAVVSLTQIVCLTQTNSH